MRYVGRFAPSPSGPLHFGSLVAALASYLDAKAHEGRWLLRIEDVDPPRCVANAPEMICDALHQHGLHWDGSVLYQSSRNQYYRRCLDELFSQHALYYCQCTRKQLKLNGGVHNNACRAKGSTDGAIRLINQSPVVEFVDRWQGKTKITDPHALEDPVLKRRDQLFAYNLAVVVDDIYQEVTHIVRGCDLLDTTSAHLSLYRQLNAPAPQYMHVPLAKNENGQKLSKQNHAPALCPNKNVENIVSACEFLRISLPSNAPNQGVDKILRLATQQWRQMLTNGLH